MTSQDPKDRARMVAQARLLEAYERVQWPRRPATLPSVLRYLMDQHGLSRGHGSDRHHVPGAESADRECRERHPLWAVGCAAWRRSKASRVISLSHFAEHVGFL